MLVNLSIRKNQLLKIYLASEIKKNSHDFILPTKDPLNYMFLTIDERLYVIFTSTGFLKIYRAFGGANPRTSWTNLTSKGDFGRYLYFNLREDCPDGVDSDFCLEYLTMSYPDLDSSSIPYYKGKNKYYYRVIYLTEVDEDYFLLKDLLKLSNLLACSDKKELNQFKMINYIKNNCLAFTPEDNAQIIENKEIDKKENDKKENTNKASDFNVEEMAPKLNKEKTLENSVQILENNVIEIEKQITNKNNHLESLNQTENEIKERIKELRKEHNELKEYHKKYKKFLKEIDLQAKLKKLSTDLKKEIDHNLVTLPENIFKEFTCEN